MAIIEVNKVQMALTIAVAVLGVQHAADVPRDVAREGRPAAGAFRQPVQDSWAGNTPDPLLLVFLALVVAAAGWAAAKCLRCE